MIHLFFESGLFIVGYMTLIFGLAILIKNNSIVDIFWGIGFILIMLFSSNFKISDYFATNLFNALILLWGFRLSIHIFIRNHSKDEDFRYKNWRNTWKYFYLRSFLQIFMLQGFIMWLISIPIIKFNYRAINEISFFYYIGISIFFIGFLFETISDYQLLNFKKNKKNKGKIITIGLWRYSRHPNYFGEALLWWGLAIAGIENTGDIYLLISPLLITLLLRYVSGVPMLEEKYKNNPEFIEYSKKTSVFIPLIQKK